jgi:SAM-dependent methyltransferase
VIDFVVVPLVVAGLVANGLRLRRRVPARLPSGGDVRPGESARWAWISSRATVLDEATRQDAVAYVTDEGLCLADLVPVDLPATAARDLVRRTDARAYRASAFAPGRGAGAAMLADLKLLARAQITAPSDVEPADVIALNRRLRPYAGEDAAIVVAPRLRAAADDLGKRRARLRATSGIDHIVGLHVALEVIPYALVVLALVADWEWGLAAAVAYCLQPYLIFAGTSLRPRGLHAAALLRLVHEPYVWARTVAGRWRSSAELRQDAETANAVGYYRAALAQGTGRFFEKRRGTCPWCGSAELGVLLRSPDLVQQKPGTFTLERCAGCGHVFQNPRLTVAGLDFYYRDAYDGLGASAAEMVFLTATGAYRARARMAQPFVTPKSWLDVGAGHGHFCEVARTIFTDTIFDGLDQGAVIEDAQRRGWITTAYRGEFRELAARLAGRYDVISMHHYLEHTREPLAELDAAARALPAGGHLLIELPDPQWRLAPLFGRYWMPWFQPEHLHMISIGNLTAALRQRGLSPVVIERGAAHQCNDAVTALYLFLTAIAPDRGKPWSPRSATALTRAWRGLVMVVGLPFLGAGVLLGQTLGRALSRRWDRGNAYRVLARKENPPDAD